ncbi:hypothetical protein KII92_03070 [Leuconostoc gelidum subsp. gasicomitatum]|uniref:hypothetical protein n=1 Tax=Leuconostoc gasicomitatum TaxID=115778 RepID=UPI001CC7DC0A|nr:hypothetical protein [Leuconostoc gasicomitatum]MBZ5943935.1 hypothetical protein [Leuconostoc gasicomitatum]MBZ5973045.1 hypothetical protein [Leuconostoc gasicomitatum]
MGRLESKRYYEIYVDGQFETSYKDRVAANLAVGQLFKNGYEVKILSFERGAKRNFENKAQKINRTHIVKHEEYGTLSNIMMKKDGTKVYVWHHDGDGRRAKLFSDNLTALSISKMIGAKIKQVSYADVRLNAN